MRHWSDQLERRPSGDENRPRRRWADIVRGEYQLYHALCHNELAAGGNRLTDNKASESDHPKESYYQIISGLCYNPLSFTRSYTNHLDFTAIVSSIFFLKILIQKVLAFLKSL